jgi:hypothetical protein
MYTIRLLVFDGKDTYWGANRGNSGRNETMPTCTNNAKVEGSTAADEDAKDPWLGGSLDSFHGAMEWNRQLS